MRQCGSRAINEDFASSPIDQGQGDLQLKDQLPLLSYGICGAWPERLLREGIAHEYTPRALAGAAPLPVDAVLSSIAATLQGLPLQLQSL